MYTVFAQFYDKLTANVDYPARAHYFYSLIQTFYTVKQKPEIILDLACGTGSLAVELSKLGCSVIATDGSIEMLSIAMAKKIEAKQDILFLCQPMDRLDLYGTVDITICALDSLNHVTSFKKLHSVFKRVALFTEQGGLFIFDVNSLYKHSEILQNNVFVYETKTVYCVWKNRFNREQLSTEIMLDFFVPHHNEYRRFGEAFTEQYYSSEQLVGLLDQVGFELLAVYRDDEFLPVNETTQRIIYVARKR